MTEREDSCIAGNKIGGQKARDTNIKKYGEDFYKKIGAKGGANGHTGGFASELIGADGMEGRTRASIVGTIGGKISKRKPRSKYAKEEA